MTKFISTTLPYVNSKPHIGHAFEFTIADIIARYYRNKQGVFFNVGVDEHGIKVQQAAEKLGHLPQDYVDALAIVWKDFCSQFEISYDNFYRTSDKRHHEAVKFFFVSTPNKYFTKKVYEGKYCVGCETFITEKEIVNGNECPIHHTQLQDIKEENWFFNLGHFKDSIKDNLVNKKYSNELANLKEDFNEISITRQNVKWGVDFDGESTFYVWYEALLSYIMAAGWGPRSGQLEQFNELWKDSLIICGPDNLKFQSYILPAILKSKGISGPKEVLVHGNILDEHGVKMSKTIGNVIDPIDQLKKWGVSPVRFYLFSLNIFGSSSYSEKDLVNVWNNEIVNNFGNLLSRLFHLVDIRKVEINPSSEFSKEFGNKYHSNKIELDNLFEQSKFREFKERLFELTSGLNKRITDEKPFAKESTDYESVLTEIFLLAHLYAQYYKLIIPEYSTQIETAFKEKKKIALFPKLDI